jgi:hypothetical protein
MNTARTVEPYLVGKDMTEEVENDFHIPLMHGSFCTGCTLKQTNNEYLKNIMEQEIMRIAKEYKQLTTRKTTETDSIHKIYFTSRNEKSSCLGF